jgi:lipoprotein-releasing system permease protein
LGVQVLIFPFLYRKTTPLAYALFIARRIIFNAQPSFSRFIIRLATVATALSVATMIITLSMVNGFQTAIAEKVYSFWGHARVHGVNPFETVVTDDAGFPLTDSIEQSVAKTSGVARFHAFAVKSVVLKTRGQFEGVLLKGVESRFDAAAFKRFITDGKFFSFEDSANYNNILLSHITAGRLQAKTGDTLQCFFIRNGQDIRTRPMVVSGIYKTGIEDYDKNFGIADIRFLRRLNLWEPNIIGGIEIFVDDVDQASTIAHDINLKLPMKYSCQTIGEIYPNIFDWLAIQNQTKRIVVITMLVVAIINLITCLLILVMERTRMVGVLKALGMPNDMIGAIFWYYAGWIATVGVGAGLVLGIGLCLLQQTTGLITMDEATYYVATAPVRMDAVQITLVAIGSLIVCLLAIRLPLLYVQRVSPIRAIRFD